MNNVRRLTILPLLLLSACGPQSGGGSATPPPDRGVAPTSTPVGNPVSTVDEAAAIVIASDARFSGVMKYDPNLIGASAWWEGEATTDGFLIKVTIGWGDCPAGCIYKHVWNYTVTSDGTATLGSETGDPLPPGSLPA